MHEQQITSVIMRPRNTITSAALACHQTVLQGVLMLGLHMPSISTLYPLLTLSK